MSYLNFRSNYDKYPSTRIEGFKVTEGYEAICKEIRSKINKENFVLCLDTYPGVFDQDIKAGFSSLKYDHVIRMVDIFKDGEKISEQLKYNITDDRVFGKMYYGELMDFIDTDKLIKARREAASNKGLTIIYGVGAAIIGNYDLHLFFDLARWEIQLRYRKGMTNFKCDNAEEDILRKYKRAFFIEWRVADKHKSKYFETFDYVLDTNDADHPKMITGEAFRQGLKKIGSQPFRTVPYFDPGVWGGQWMKEVCQLDPSKKNYAWSFDGVPEENSILLEFDNASVELPAMDLVLYRPKQLLGMQVYSRFGAEFPIRFDFLDTIEGQNLSLQVHPVTEYIKKQFGMTYTQDESYYILDAVEGAHVYLGLKDGINKEQMINDLREAQNGKHPFDAEKYINKFPAKKHDHFLIPAGTCHCSGSGAMVLEISATPYIFTFKLWDWDRLGLDGKPRPVHIEHGKEVIQWDRTTQWVKKNLVNAVYEIDDPDNKECKVEHTGLHELEFIETRRYHINKTSIHKTKGNVNMLNLIDGPEAVVESPTDSFKPFTVHYAETFIIPASVSEYTIRPADGIDEVCVIKAYVRY